MDTAIIIPCYNEEENICRLIKSIKKEIDAYIIIVDDSDNNLTKKLVSKKKKVYYFKRQGKLGRGSAILFGLKKAIKFKKVNLFIEMDADLSHSPAELSVNINYFKKKKLDLLVASRYLKGSQIINWPISRRIFSLISNFLAKILLGIPVSDYTNGFRIYSKKSADLIIANAGRIGDGFIILSEILLILHNNRFKIGEIKSKFINRTRGESSINFKLIKESFFGLIKLYLIKKNYLNVL
jgi:dolichol-phosphate mannosyltransferase